METVATAARTEEIVRRTIEHLRRKVRVDLVVLFGSSARGKADTWSDVDLASVSPNFARISHRKILDLLVEVALAVDPSVDIRPHTPRDLKEARVRPHLRWPTRSR